jgi:hypothetical protein
MNHNVGSKIKIIHKCKRGIFTLQREVKFYIDTVLQEYKMPREAVLTHYIQQEVASSSDESQGLSKQFDSGSQNQKDSSKAQAT